MRKLPFILLFILIATSVPSSGQTIHLLDSGMPGVMIPTYLPSPGYPVGAPSFFGPVPLPTSGILGAPPLGGGLAIDQSTSRVFATDGLLITTDYNFSYAPFTAPLPPVPPAPAPLLLGGGPITGMGADPAAGILWLTDGVSYAPAVMAAPFPLAAPPAPLPFALLGPFLTGIDFEASTGTLWGVDAAGGVYNWLPFGGPIGPQPVAVVAAPGPGLAPFSGIAVNECNGAGAIAAPFCSTQLPGFHVVVTNGVFLYDALVANPPIPLVPVSGAPARGLAFSSDMQHLPGAGSSPVPAGFPGWAKAQNNGVGGLNALRLIGAAPLTTTLFLYDLCPIPGGLGLPASGETLWINPLSPSFTFATLVTDGMGGVTVPIDMTFAPTGLTLSSQFATYSPGSPLGYALSDAMIFTIGLP